MHVEILPHHKPQSENLSIDSGLVARTSLATSTLGAFAVTIFAIIHRFFLELTKLAAFSTVALPRACTVWVGTLLVVLQAFNLHHLSMA